MERLLRDETGRRVGGSRHHRHRRRLQHLRERGVQILHARAHGADDLRVLSDVLEGLARQRDAVAEENDAGDARDQLGVFDEAELRCDEACEELRADAERGTDGETRHAEEERVFGRGGGRNLQRRRESVVEIAERRHAEIARVVHRG